MKLDDVRRCLTEAAVTFETRSEGEWRCWRADLPMLDFTVRVTESTLVCRHVLQPSRPPLTESDAEALLYACGALTAVKLVANDDGTCLWLEFEWPLRHMRDEFLLFAIEDFALQIEYVRRELPRFCAALPTAPR